MQSDLMLPLEKWRNYSSVWNACRRIPAEEGILSLWKGGGPTVTRAMFANLGMFTTYEESKERFTALMPNHKQLAWVLSSFFAGGVAASISLPFDNAKTKMQKMTAGSDGKMPYKNIFDCIRKEIINNGPKGLYAGLPTYVIRIVPHVMLTFICSEKLKKLMLWNIFKIS